MGIVNTSSFAKDLYPGVNAWYGIEYKKYPQEHLMIFDKEISDRAWEEDVGYSGLGLAAIKTQGGSISYDEMQQGFIDRYNHLVYGLGFIVTREMIEDGIAIPRAMKSTSGLAFSMNQTIETVGANVLNNAYDNTYTYGDGVELCSTAHPNKAGGTWRNELAVASDLNEDAIEQASIDIADLKDDRGNKIALRIKALIIPKELEFEAVRYLQSQLRPDTADNDINAIRALGIIPKVVVNHYLDDPNAFFFKTDCPQGLKHFQRRAMEFENDNPDFDTENLKFKVTYRGSWGATDKRSIFGSPGA